MILYLPGNILKAARAVPLGDDLQFCQASTEEMASIQYSEASVQALFTARIEFILELEREEIVPVFVELKAHRLNATVGVAWFVPKYFKYPKPRYDVEYRWHGASKGDERLYKSGLAEAQLDHLASHADISRVYSVHGLTEPFLDRFALKLIEKGRFHYAIPRKL